uniref:Uncharacterized protein n=1 Tax=Anopheles funestus TaxID=62324 RepID=A0A182RIH2_ANOFN
MQLHRCSLCSTVSPTLHTEGTRRYFVDINGQPCLASGLANYWRALYMRQLDGIVERTLKLQETTCWDDFASLKYLLIMKYLFPPLVFGVWN